MNNKIFREKSIDRISSPEQLDEYVKVSNPGVWMILGAVAVLLAGMCVWSFWGRLDTTLSAAAVADNGVLTCYINQADIQTVKKGMSVTVEQQTYTLGDIDENAFTVTQEPGAGVLYAASLEPADTVYTSDVSTVPEDGVYEAVITVESIAPISFVLNRGTDYE